MHGRVAARGAERGCGPARQVRPAGDAARPAARGSSPAGSASASPSPAPCAASRGSSSATSRSARSTCPRRPASSTCSSRSSSAPASPTCSSRTTSPSSGTSATASRVMYRGEIVESGDGRHGDHARPQHPYTQRAPARRAGPGPRPAGRAAGATAPLPRRAAGRIQLIAPSARPAPDVRGHLGAPGLCPRYFRPTTADRLPERPIPMTRTFPDLVDVAIVGSGPAGRRLRAHPERALPARHVATLRGRPAAHRSARRAREEHRRPGGAGPAQRLSEGPAPQRDDTPTDTMDGYVDTAPRLVRPGTFLLAAGYQQPGEDGLPSAAMSSNVGGMAAHWTGACPRPGGSERITLPARPGGVARRGRAAAGRGRARVRRRPVRRRGAQAPVRRLRRRSRRRPEGGTDAPGGRPARRRPGHLVGRRRRVRPGHPVQPELHPRPPGAGQRVS